MPRRYANFFPDNRVRKWIDELNMKEWGRVMPVPKPPADPSKPSPPSQPSDEAVKLKNADCPHDTRMKRWQGECAWCLTSALAAARLAGAREALGRAVDAVRALPHDTGHCEILNALSRLRSSVAVADGKHDAQ